MKKNIWILFAALSVICCLSACGQTDAADHSAEEKQLQIVTTIFPEYDWIREILGDHAKDADITMLLDNGVDLHNYQPTASDILKIGDCDLFVYVGGESDGWVSDVLTQASGQDRKTVNLLEALGDDVREEEVVDGMETEAHDQSEAENGGGHEDAEEPEYDEHVWLSLKNAQVLCGVIADALAEIDPQNADDYQANMASYCEKLASLDTEYESAVKDAAQKTLLFGDRFPFRYLADDYGLSYYAAFLGCSAETEASFETIAFLAAKADELDLHTILTVEKSDQKIAQTIVSNLNKKDRQILALDSMQSVTAEDVSDGCSYLSIMESNLGVLKAALQ